jgi:hypothetical protein
MKPDANGDDSNGICFISNHRLVTICSFRISRTPVGEKYVSFKNIGIFEKHRSSVGPYRRRHLLQMLQPSYGISSNTVPRLLLPPLWHVPYSALLEA